jgi:hypothetical protein
VPWSLGAVVDDRGWWRPLVMVLTWRRGVGIVDDDGGRRRAGFVVVDDA